MISLKIYGQTPSKKSSQVMVTTRLSKKFIEAEVEKLFERSKSFKELYDVEVYYQAMLKKIKSSTKNILLPNKKYMEWIKQAIFQLKKQMKEQRFKTIKGKVSVHCMIYRYTKRRMDLLNAQQSIHDALEDAGIIENDFYIDDTDKSRLILGVPKGEERAEIFITIVDPF